MSKAKKTLCDIKVLIKSKIYEVIQICNTEKNHYNK